VIQRTFPPRNADTPFVTRLQPGKSPFRAWRDQIVPVEHGKIEKFLADFYANRVQPNIFRTSPTKSIAIKAGDRIATATFQFGSDNVGWHEASLTWKFSLLNIGLLKMHVGSECVFRA
jgi:hypothetical protein